MDRGALGTYGLMIRKSMVLMDSMVHRVKKSKPRLKRLSAYIHVCYTPRKPSHHVPFENTHTPPLEEEMVAKSSVLDWKIPWTEEPGVLRSMGWQRVRWD